MTGTQSPSTVAEIVLIVLLVFVLSVILGSLIIYLVIKRMKPNKISRDVPLENGKKIQTFSHDTFFGNLF